jgi:uncharacterized protein YciI
MMQSRKPSVYYVMFAVTKYRDFEAAKVHASEEIAAHVARSKELHRNGTLLMSGAFLNNPDEPLTTMAVLSSREAAEEYIKGDPFFLKGMIRHWYIREWAITCLRSSRKTSPFRVRISKSPATTSQQL